ncbi:MAG: hypothetical protein ACRDZW_03635 [Acidimicrobiales bacterium]
MDEVDGLLADLARWTGEHRSAAAAESRVRQRWLRQQAVEDARFAGLVLDLSERATTVVVRTITGRSVRGRIVAVAADCCLIGLDGGPPTLVRLEAMASVRPEPGRRATEADAERAAPAAATMADVLAGMAAERPRVRIGLVGPEEPFTGELRAVGADVVTIRLDGDAAAVVYLRLAAVAEVTLLG